MIDLIELISTDLVHHGVGKVVEDIDVDDHGEEEGTRAAAFSHERGLYRSRLYQGITRYVSIPFCPWA
jgi:hypothetical protein